MTLPKNQIKLIQILSLVLLGALTGIIISTTVSGVNSPYRLGSQEKMMFSVEKGQGFFEIAQALEKEKLVKSSLSFEVSVFLLNGAGRLQAGQYELSPGLTPLEIAGKLIQGEVARQVITIPEGWNLKEINSYLINRGLSKGQEFSAAATRDYSAEFGFLKDKPAGADLEGYLFPDTYELENGGTAENLVSMMLKNFDDKLTPDLRTEIGKQRKSIFEVVTMASLLEKEAKTLEDKKIVSGILWKRLRVGMRLQVDATILYALSRLSGVSPTGYPMGSNPGQISYEQTRIDSPYNTYRYAGLPLGPIANPGLDSLKAAIYPTENPYWYYLSTPTGQILFSQTLEEHNVKKVKYLK